MCMVCPTLSENEDVSYVIKRTIKTFYSFGNFKTVLANWVGTCQHQVAHVQRSSLHGSSDLPALTGPMVGHIFTLQQDIYETHQRKYMIDIHPCERDH